MVDENYAQQVARWQRDANQRNQQAQQAQQEYQNQIARWRQMYDQQDRATRLQNIRADGAAAQQERDAAIARGDIEEAELRDRDVRELAAQWRELNPPGPPPQDPRMVEYARRRAGHFQKPGAIAEADLAHKYATARPHPNPTPQAVGSGQHGMGLQPGTPAYFKAVDTLQQMYGTKGFSDADVMPGEREVAKISGLSLDEYRKAAQEMQRQQRFSWQQKR